jgi:hypothetical protein
MNQEFIMKLFFIFLLFLSSNLFAETFSCRFYPDAGDGRVFLITVLKLSNQNVDYFTYVGREDFTNVNIQRKKCERMVHLLNTNPFAIKSGWEFSHCDDWIRMEVFSLRFNFEGQNYIFIPAKSNQVDVAYRQINPNCEGY